MKGMILVFLLLGMTCAQVTRTNNRFLRFDDSFEKDSNENVFIGGNNNGIQRARFDDDDSDERVFFRSPTTATTTNKHFSIPRQNFASPSRNTFSTPNRNTFSSPSTRNTFGSTPSRNTFGTSNNAAFLARFDDDDDSDERFFGGSNTFKSNVNNRNRFDDSRESFRKPNTFSFSNNNLNKRTHFDDSDEVKSSFRNTFNRNTNSLKTNNRIDSVEDLFEDLFDNDLDDRVRAQNTLSSLGFGNQVNNRLNTFNNNNSFSSNSNNQRSTISNKKTTSGSLSNSIKSDPFSNVKRSEFFPNTPGFNWPGGNGYYVRMSTGNSKPFSYFVKYDD